MQTPDGHEPEAYSNEHITSRQWPTTDWVQIQATASVRFPRAAEYVVVVLPKKPGSFSGRRILDLPLH